MGYISGVGLEEERADEEACDVDEDGNWNSGLKASVCYVELDSLVIAKVDREGVGEAHGGGRKVKGKTTGT